MDIYTKDWALNLANNCCNMGYQKKNCCNNFIFLLIIYLFYKILIFF